MNLQTRGFGDLNLSRMIAWLPGDEIVFSARYGEATNLWRIPIAHMGDAMPSAVTLGPWDQRMASVRGKHVAFTNSRTTNQVWRIAVDWNSGKVTGAPERITEDLIEAQFPDVRPDDSMLAYISRKGGGQGVFVRDLRTGRDRRVYQGPISSAYATFSPDGSRVAFGNGGMLWPARIVPVAGGDPQMVGNAEGRIRGWTNDGRYLLTWQVPPANKPTSVGLLELSTSKSVRILQAEQEVGAPRLSPDNRWLAFQKNSGQRAIIFVAPFRGATPVPESEWIRMAPGVNPFWSPDSRSICFARYTEGAVDASMLMRQQLDPATGHAVSQPTEFYRASGDMDNRIINTPVASRSYLYFLLKRGMSEIWTMDLPD
jgi:Tol biopolymer transport system component